MLHRQFFVYFSVVPLIVSVSYFEILRFLSVTEIYILIFINRNSNYLAFSVSFTDGSISDIHSPTKVYTFCQYGALFTKCTIM